MRRIGSKAPPADGASVNSDRTKPETRRAEATRSALDTTAPMAPQPFDAPRPKPASTAASPQYSWLSIQGGAARPQSDSTESALPRALVARHLAVLLKKSGSAREAEWASTPDEVRRDPEYVKRLLGEEYHYFEWIAKKGDEDAVRSVLADPANVVDLKSHIGGMLPYVTEAVLNHPEVRKLMAQALAGWGDYFPKLPEMLRLDGEFVEIALARSLRYAAHIPLDRASASVIAIVEKWALHHLSEKPDLSTLPSALRNSDFLSRLVAATPLAWVQLTAKERAAADQVFANPEVSERSVPLFAKRFEEAWYKRPPEMWADVPEPLRDRPDYLRLLLQHESDVVVRAGLTPDRMDALFSDPASIAGFAGWALANASQHFGETTLARPHIRNALLSTVKAKAEYFSRLHESLRADSEFIEIALADSSTFTAKNTPLDKIDSALRERIEEALIAHWKSRKETPSFSDLPPALQASPAFLRNLLRNWPSMPLPAAAQAQLRDVFDDPEVLKRAAESYVQRWSSAYGDDDRDALFRNMPAEVRTHPLFVRGAMSHWTSAYFARAVSEVEVEAIAKALSDVAFLASEGTPLFSLAPKLRPEVLAALAVRQAAGKRLAESQYASLRDAPLEWKTDELCIQGAISRSASEIVHVPVPAKEDPTWPLVRSGWLAYLSGSAEWKEVPTELRSEPAFIAEALVRRPRLYGTLSEEDRALGSVALTHDEFYTQAGSNIVGIAGLLPPAAWDDPRLHRAVASQLKNINWGYRDLPEPLKISDAVVTALLQCDLEQLRLVPYGKLSSASKSRVRQAAANFLDQNSWHHWNDMPEELRQNADFISASLRKHFGLVDRLKEEELALAAPVLGDIDFLVSSKQSIFTLLRHAPASLQEDPRVTELLLSLVEKDSGHYASLPSDLKTHPRAVVARVAERGLREIPPEALTEENLRAIFAKSPALLSGVERGRLSDTLYEDAIHALITSVDSKSRLDSIPSVFREDIRLKSEFLRVAGLAGFNAYGVSDMVHDPNLWTDAPRARVVEYLERYPEKLSVVASHADKDPELAALAARKARSDREREAVYEAVDPEMFASAQFIDECMQVDPLVFTRAALELRADPDRARRAIQAHPGNIDSALLDRKTLVDVLRAVDLPSLSGKTSPWSEEAQLDSLRYSSEAFDLRTPDFAIAVLARAPARTSELPPRLLSDPSFWLRVAEQAPRALANWPLTRLEPSVRTSFEAAVLHKLSDEPSLYEHLPEPMRKDPSVLGSVVDRWPQAILHAAGGLEKDQSLWMRALTKDALLIEKRPNPGTVLLDHAVAAAVKQIHARRIGPKQIPKVLYQASNEVPKASIEAWGGHGVSWFKSWMQHSSIQDAVRQKLLREPEALATGLEAVPEELAQIIAALPCEPGTLNRAALRFSLALADRKPGAVVGLPAAYQNHPAVRELSWASDPPRGAIRQVSSAAERKAIVSKRPQEILELPSDQRTPELMGAAVSIDGALLRHAPAELRDDDAIVKAAVTSNGLALEHASDRLRRDPEIVGQAIRSTPGAMAYSRCTGADARAVELIAVREGGLIDERLERLKDQDFVLAFAEHLADNRYTGKVRLRDQIYRFAHHLDDPEFVRKLIDLQPSFLREMPEKYWTDENLFTACKRTSDYYDTGFAKPEPRLDPLKLPKEAWPELARAFPGSFVRRFQPSAVAPESLSELKAAVLVAIEQNHAVIESIASEWWKDSEFIGAAVRVNPFVLEKLGPSRRRWLSELEPEPVAEAKHYLDLVKESGFKLKRFEGRDPLLRELIDNRFTAGRSDNRPTAVVVYPKDDWNGAFDHLKFEKLTRKYRVMYYEAGSATEMARAIYDGTRFGPAEVVVLAAHGAPDSLTWGDASQSPDNPPLFRPEHATMLAQMVPAERLAQGAKVIFDACSVGGGGKYRRNLVNVVGEVWPHVWLQAAWQPSSSGNRFLLHEDGELDRMDFRASETLRPVPYHVGVPSRTDYRARRQHRGIE